MHGWQSCQTDPRSGHDIVPYQLALNNASTDDAVCRSMHIYMLGRWQLNDTRLYQIERLGDGCWNDFKLRQVGVSVSVVVEWGNSGSCWRRQKGKTSLRTFHALLVLCIRGRSSYAYSERWKNPHLLTMPTVVSVVGSMCTPQLTAVTTTAILIVILYNMRR